MAISNITAPTPTTTQLAHRTKRLDAGSIRSSTGLLNIQPPLQIGKPTAFHDFKWLAACHDLDQKIGNKVRPALACLASPPDQNT